MSGYLDPCAGRPFKLSFVLVVALCFGAACIAPAQAFDYGLKPVKVADDTYVFFGKEEFFSRANGGNVVNTSFIVTETGVVVIDTGISRLYGEQMRAAIAVVSPLPIVKVLITHHHPDHFLGNQAFRDAPIAALGSTIRLLQAEGEDLAENMYRLVGDSMLGTEVVLPSEATGQSSIDVGGHRLKLIPLRGHTGGDLAVFDETTGVLFAGDLVFWNRAVATSHANPGQWLQGLRRLNEVDFRLLVPGHGQVVTDGRAISQTADYLRWLTEHLATAVESGLEMTEVMRSRIPERFSDISIIRGEFKRSVQHLWPGMVRRELPAAQDRRQE